MKTSNNDARKRSADAALGSVRAEGLKPSVKTQKRVEKFVQGKISKTNLRMITVQEMRQLNRAK